MQLLNSHAFNSFKIDKLISKANFYTTILRQTAHTMLCSRPLDHHTHPHDILKRGSPNGAAVFNVAGGCGGPNVDGAASH